MSGTNLRPFSGGSTFGGHPLDVYRQFRQEMDQLLSQFGQLGIQAGWGGGQGTQQQQGEQVLIPLADAVEDHDNYRIAVEVPGVDPQQIEANVSGSTLTIQAYRQDQEGQQGGQQGGQQAQQSGGQQGGQQQGRHWLIRERTYNRIRRTFQLPNDIDGSRISAECRNGLLTVTLPRSAQARDQRRRIEIKAN